MKKVLITMAVLTSLVAGAMVFSSFATPKQKNGAEITLTVPTNGPGCVRVGNCTVEISGPWYNDRYDVQANNANPYRVSVDWSAYGYNDNGDRIKVGGGTLTVGGTNEDSHCNSTSFNCTATNVHLDDVRVLRCN